MTIRPVSTQKFIGLSETNTIGYLLTSREPAKPRTRGFDHRVGHCGVFHMTAMSLYVPVGRSPSTGRKRPYTIGATADVEAAQSLYPSITPHRAKTEEGKQGPR
jgi:hypothetical protein